MNNTSLDHPYRWMMMTLCVLALLGQTFTWLAPAPLLGKIITGLNISVGKAGSLLTVITLVTGLFAFAGSFFVDKLGAKLAMFFGLLMFGLGGCLSFFATDYVTIFSFRFLVGLGFGIALPIAGVIVASWFSPREQQYMNAIIVIVSYVGMALAYTITLPIYDAVGSWQKTLATIGAYVVIVAFVWILLARNKPVEDEAALAEPGVEEEPLAPIIEKASGLKQAAKRKEVWLLTLMLLGVMWTFNTFTTFLAMFFEQVRGMDVAVASGITGSLPIAGIVGGVLCGVATGKLGLRKPFTWPLFLLMIIGAVGSVYVEGGPMLYLSVGLLGFGAAGFSPIFFQVPMELEGATPEMVGGALAIIIGVSYILSYFSPLVFGALVEGVGFATTLLMFAGSLLLSTVAGLMIPETGWRRVPVEVTV